MELYLYIVGAALAYNTWRDYKSESDWATVQVLTRPAMLTVLWPIATPILLFCALVRRANNNG